jgi:hypothetical protein
MRVSTSVFLSYFSALLAALALLTDCHKKILSKIEEVIEEYGVMCVRLGIIYEIGFKSMLRQREETDRFVSAIVIPVHSKSAYVLKQH